MVTITSLAKDERSARVALAATLEPDDAVTGRLIAAVGAVETMRLAAGTGAFPKKVDSVDAGLWRNKVSPRLDARTVTQALSETDRLGLHILIPGDRDWPTALNDLGERAPTVLWVRGTVSFLSATLSDRVTITGARAATTDTSRAIVSASSDVRQAMFSIAAAVSPTMIGTIGVSPSSGRNPASTIRSQWWLAPRPEVKLRSTLIPRTGRSRR